MQKKRILVPIDGSQFSRQIFVHLSRYLDPAQNELILLRVGEPRQGSVGKPMRPAAPDTDVAMFETRQDQLAAQHPIYASQEYASAQAELAREFQHDIHLLEQAGYTAATEIRFDEQPGPAIVNYIENHDIDLVAMTTHGRTGVNRLFFGSVAEYIVRHVSIPIMMVRPRT